MLLVVTQTGTQTHKITVTLTEKLTRSCLIHSSARLNNLFLFPPSLGEVIEADVHGSSPSLGGEIEADVHGSSPSLGDEMHGLFWLSSSLSSIPCTHRLPHPAKVKTAFPSSS